MKKPSAYEGFDLNRPVKELAGNVMFASLILATLDMPAWVAYLHSRPGDAAGFLESLEHVLTKGLANLGALRHELARTANRGVQ